jgi:hypothetical protein
MPESGPGLLLWLLLKRLSVLTCRNVENINALVSLLRFECGWLPTAPFYASDLSPCNGVRTIWFSTFGPNAL